jgi:hypothetical protein
MPPACTPVVARINFVGAPERRGCGAGVTRVNQMMRANRCGPPIVVRRASSASTLPRCRITVMPPGALTLP